MNIQKDMENEIEYEIQEERQQREKPEWMRIILKALEERAKHNGKILQSQGL